MKYLVAFLVTVGMFSSVHSAHAGPANAGKFINKKVECFETDSLLDVLADVYGEQIVVYASNQLTDNSALLVMMNPTTESFTFVEVRNKVACVLGTGDKITIVPQDRSTFFEQTQRVKRPKS